MYATQRLALPSFYAFNSRLEARFCLNALEMLEVAQVELTQKH
jgi:hypothetical protein